MATVIDIDAGLLPRAHENFWLDMDDVSPGPGLDGREQVLFTENRRWIGRLDFVRMRPAALRSAVVIGDQLHGRANILRIPVCNFWAPRTIGDAGASGSVSESDASQGLLPYEDGSLFDDGTGFALPAIENPTVSAAAVVGASAIKMSGYLGRHLPPGAFFSVADFLYRIEANADGYINFNPPLRQDVTETSLVEAIQPKIQVRLQAKSGWRPFCEYFRNGQPMTVNVIEAFDR